MQAKHLATMAALCLAFVGISALTARSQEPAKDAKREAIEAEFLKDLAAAEKAKIARLGELAASQPKAEASATYGDLFRFAIGAGLYEPAEPIAEKVVATPGLSPEAHLLAHLVNVVAEANRGAFEESLSNLAKAMDAKREIEKDGGANAAAPSLPLEARVSLINTYIQRLIHARRYDVAMKALTTINAAATDPHIKDLVESRIAQIALVGKPAPAIVGTDLDGKPVALADLKGKYVLVLFWASWCAPNAQEADAFGKLYRRYQPKGFQVIGINVDSKQDGGVPAASVMPAVRRFLVEHNVTWPNLLNGTGADDHVKAFGVTQLPSDVLIDRDGKVIHIDLDVKSLEATLATLFGS